MLFRPKTPKSPEKIEKRRRFWRTARRRLFWTLAVLFVAHSALNIYGSVLLNRELAAIRQKGEPLNFAEMAPSAVPDSQNAALIYARAADALQWSNEEKAAVAVRKERRSPREEQLCASVVTKNERALNLARSAASMPRCRFALDYNNAKPFFVQFSHLSQAMKLAHLLALRAELKAKNGDSATSLQDARALFGIAHHLSNEPTYNGFLAAYTIDGLANRALSQTLENTKMSLSQTQALNSSLPLTDWSRGFRRAMLGERASHLALFDAIDIPHSWFTALDPQQAEAFSWVFRLLRWLWRPFLKLDEVQTLRLWHRQLDSPDFQQIPRAVGAANALDLTSQNAPRYAMFTRWFFPGFARASDFRDAAQVRRRQREVALILVAYRSARGRYPANLEAATRWRGAVLPLDFYSQKPFVYRLTNDGFWLYSVGPNRVDDANKNFFRQITTGKKWGAGDNLVWGEVPREIVRFYDPPKNANNQ